MTTSSEDVLLQMGEVRYKKGDGTLYVMNERIAWMVEHRDTVAVSHKFQDIKLQKISPEGKPKVQLQVVLHDGNSSTFHFVNKAGQAAQLADRDKVKELLQQLLPNFKRKVDKELEEKNRILSENPSLLQLYKDLVITQVLTSEEFWSTHAKDFALKSNQTQAKQSIGVSGAFLADIKPQTDGCNGFRYNLTGDIIECIFKTYPAVKRKHAENVPAKMSESEFWTKFFQSHYFHRDRIAGATKDIFAECGRIDDQALKADVAKGAGDPLLDLRLFDDNTLEEGFGGAVVMPEPSDKSSSSHSQYSGSGNIVHQNMIKRFNQHSMMVLKTCTEVIPGAASKNNSLNPSSFSNTSSSTSSSNSNGQKNNKHGEANGVVTDELNNNVNGGGTGSLKANGVNGCAAADGGGALDEPRAKVARIMEKIKYDDLMGLDGEEDMAGGSASETNGGRSSQLNLLKVERYLHGPMPGTMNPTFEMVNNGKGGEDASLLDLNATQANICGMTDGWAMRTPHKALVSATAAVNALGELSPGGALMRGFQEQSLAQLVPPDVEKELRGLYLAVCELLKHFWKTFPPTTPDLEAKAERMHEALHRFKLAKLKPFEERALREFAPLGASLTQHLNQLLESAARRYTKWQEIRMRQMR